MPQRHAPIKELRKNHKNQMRNLDIKTDLKKTLKKFLSAVEGDKKDEAKGLLNAVYKKLDKASKRNILSKNTASRRKSRFSKMLQTAK